jgi:DNA-binding HxlR family transcriptional regulator
MNKSTKALGHILEHGSLTIQDFERLCPEVHRRSLQRDLKAMVDRGLVVTRGETHHLLYRLAERG